MAGMRSILSVNVSLGLFGFPVSVYKAVNEPTEGIAFRQIHNKCGQPINVVKRCQHCAEDITTADLVKGVANGPTAFVTFTDAEVKALHPEAAGVIKIAGYLKADEIDACYQDGAVYYLKPDGKDATTFTTWRDALAGRWAVGSIVMYGREHVVAIRVIDKLLAMHTIRTHAEIRDVFAVPGYDKVPEASPREYAELMGQLIDREMIAFDEVVLERDSYVQAVKDMIAARLAGTELPGPAPVKEQTSSKDIMALLKASLAAKGAAA